MAYATSSDFAQYINKAGVPLTDSDDIDLVGAFLAPAQVFIDNYTGRTFEANSDTIGSSDAYNTRKFDAYADVDDLELFFDRDLAEISTITNGDGTTVVSSDYVTNPRNDAPFYSVKLKGSAGLQWEYDTSGDAEDAISIAGIWAFSKTAPSDIKQATLKLSAKMYLARYHQSEDADRPIRTSEGLTIMPADIPKDVQRALALRKRVKIGAG